MLNVVTDLPTDMAFHLRLPSRPLALALLAACALTGVVLVGRRSSSTEATSRAETPAASPPQGMASTEGRPRESARLPSLEPSVVASSPTSSAIVRPIADPVARLTQALDSDDDREKLEAIQAIVEKHESHALPSLMAVDLAREPESAPSVIRAVAKLGKEAGSADKALATKTLGRWLNEESKRLEADAAGNVPNLVEALGEIGGRESVDAMVTALESGRLDLSVQTLVVQTLGELNDHRALTATRNFLDRVSRIPPSEGIDEELRIEAIAAAKSAVSTLQGG